MFLLWAVATVALLIVALELADQIKVSRLETELLRPAVCHTTSGSIPGYGEITIQLEGALWRQDGQIPARIYLREQPEEDFMLILGIRKYNATEIKTAEIRCRASDYAPPDGIKVASLVGPGMLMHFPSGAEGLFRISVAMKGGGENKSVFPFKNDLIVEVVAFRDAVLKPSLLRRIWPF